MKTTTVLVSPHENRLLIRGGWVSFPVSVSGTLRRSRGKLRVNRKRIPSGSLVLKIKILKSKAPEINAGLQGTSIGPSHVAKALEEQTLIAPPHEQFEIRL